jgi:hypothetical protein
MRICVIALPRSGSSIFCKHLAEKYSLKNLGEVFRTAEWCTTKSSQVLNLSQNNIIYKLVPQNIAGFVIGNFVKNNYKSYSQKIQMAKLQDNLFRAEFYSTHKEKLIPMIDSMCIEIASHADTHFFIERRDLKNQILSFAALLQTNQGGKNRLEKVYIEDRNIITAKDFAFGMIGIPFYKNLKNVVYGDTVFTEDLTELSDAPRYPSQELLYNTELLREVSDVL